MCVLDFALLCFSLDKYTRAIFFKIQSLFPPKFLELGRSSCEFSLSETDLHFFKIDFTYFVCIYCSCWHIMKYHTHCNKTQLVLWLVTRVSAMWSIGTITGKVCTVLTMCSKTLKNNSIRSSGKSWTAKWPSTNTHFSLCRRCRHCAEAGHLLSLFNLAATNNSLLCLWNVTLHATCPITFRNPRSWFVALNWRCHCQTSRLVTTKLQFDVFRDLTVRHVTLPSVWLAVVIEADIAALLGDSVCCPAKVREWELQKQAGGEFEAPIQHPLLLARR